MIRTLRRTIAAVTFALTPLTRGTPPDTPVEPASVSDEEQKLEKAFGACFASVRPEIAARYAGPKASIDDQVAAMLKARNIRYRNAAVMVEVAQAEFSEFVQARMR